MRRLTSARIPLPRPVPASCPFTPSSNKDHFPRMVWPVQFTDPEPLRSNLALGELACYYGHMYLQAHNNRESARRIVPCSRHPRNSLPAAFRLSHFYSSSVIFGSFSIQFGSNSVTFSKASSYEKLQNVTECDSFVGFPLYRTALHKPKSAPASPLSLDGRGPRRMPALTPSRA